MGSGALCSSGLAVTLLELAGDNLCSCPELSPRSDTTRPSSFGGGTLTSALTTASSPGRPRTGCSEASLISCQGASQSGEGGVGESRGQESAAHFREEEAEVRTGLGSPQQNVLRLHHHPWEEGASTVHPRPHWNVTSCRQGLRPANTTFSAPRTVVWHIAGVLETCTK